MEELVSKIEGDEIVLVLLAVEGELDRLAVLVQVLPDLLEG